MIEFMCGCAAPKQIPEAATGRRFRCPVCQQTLQLVAGETLPEGSGAGDFDAGLTVTAGPNLVGTRFLVGGVAEIQIGKLPDRQILLGGENVSRAHCRLARIDFGPSRWKLIDNSSRNGIFVNGVRVAERELREGDSLTIGDYTLSFGYHTAPSNAVVVEAASPLAGVHAASAPSMAGGAVQVCPSCEKSLAMNAKICVDCGIDIVSGRPVLTSQGVDENSFYEAAHQWIRWVSLLIWINPMPIPIRSEAFGTRKPYAIWTIAAITVCVSILFFIAQRSGPADSFDRPGNNLMLWAPSSPPKETSITPERMHQLVQNLTDDERANLRDKVNDPFGHLPDDRLIAKAAAAYAEEAASQDRFHFYQLITHAFLHDPSSYYRFLMHLSGNMLFLLVFGTRVNAMIGDMATAILYPILAVCAGAAQMLSMGRGATIPLLGASGAIMGLAGIYLILFPAHRIFCAIWIGIWLSFRRIFRVRGFWILCMYFFYDILMNLITSHHAHRGGVAHWAHIGGFLTGMIIGLGILFSRQFNTHGGDVLSVTLGKYAWPLIGKPSRWIKEPEVLPRATSLSFA